MEVSETTKNMKSYNEIQFWHRVKLNDGTYTNGTSDVSNHSWYYFNQIDFKDKVVLDIGAWDGYFSFEAERRGAKEVVSMDSMKCRWGGMDGYNFLHNHYNSNAKYVEGNVYKLNKLFPPLYFDIVLCYGVLYHLSDPLFVMNQIFKITKETVAFEGLMHDDKNRNLTLLPHGLYNHCGIPDPSNFYSMSKGYADYVCGINGFEAHSFNWSMPRASYAATRKSNNTIEYFKFGFNNI